MVVMQVTFINMRWVMEKTLLRISTALIAWNCWPELMKVKSLRAAMAMI
ncbi:hypothetical protein [Cellvibrio sp. KY-GH-1]|nr:hypothetical protein [Cellvibrio sp. KY-GH-1]